jgi:hypothetical protein
MSIFCTISRAQRLNNYFVSVFVLLLLHARIFSLPLSLLILLSYSITVRRHFFPHYPICRIAIYWFNIADVHITSSSYYLSGNVYTHV